MPLFAIVGKRFTPDEFRSYLKGLAPGGFKPSMVVLHNTASPTIEQRPDGFKEKHMGDLVHYYGVVQGWSGGPHLFVDDLGIWVFNRLDRRGTHSPSWNSKSFGVEMLGDFSRESFDSGRGLAIQKNAAEAVAALFVHMGIEPDDKSFRLHKEDPETNHNCPGKAVSKSAMLTQVRERMTAAEVMGVPVRVVIYRKNRGQDTEKVDGELIAGTTMVDAQELARACGLKVGLTGKQPLRVVIGDRFTASWKPETSRVYLVERP